MSLRFRYRQIAMGHMIASLGGRTIRPRPLVSIQVIAPTAAIVRPALLDSGSDETVFPEVWARLLGLDLSGAPAGKATLANLGDDQFPLRTDNFALDGRD